MRYLALACDYDGTIAHNGCVTPSTVAALERLRGTGRKIILVTGREVDDLMSNFNHLEIFDRVVAENGGVLYDPATRETTALAEPPPIALIDNLRKRGVAPLSVGRVIVATFKPHEAVVLESIRDLGLELQVIFNKEAVMVLPAGVNKASGLGHALDSLGLSPHEVVGVGDAENDHAFLNLCECAVAVQNALPTVKDRADLVTDENHGRGVESLAERLITNDLQEVESRLARHFLLLGHRESGDEIRLPPYDCNLLIAGPSGSGKSTVAKSVLERLRDNHYQFCIVDPEGDYDGLEGAVTIGSSKRGPNVDEILQLLKNPGDNVVVNLVGVPLADRPPFFLSLLPRLQEMRGKHGRPHWIVIDEAHHLLPAAWEPGIAILPRQLDRMVFLTVHPEQIMRPALEAVTTLVAVGADPEKTIARFCSAVGQPPPTGMNVDRFESNAAEATIADPNRVWFWRRRDTAGPFAIKFVPGRGEHRRHIRKYAEGELPPERCFYFRGAEGKLNLKAQNLLLFNQIAAGVDDDTWIFHLKQGDYARWFRDGIHDEVMASAAEQIEKTEPASPGETRESIKSLIERYYTVPASAPLPMPGTIAELKDLKSGRPIS